MIIVYDITFRMLPAWMYETFNEEFVERFKNMISIKKHIKYDIGDLSHINLEIPIDKEYISTIESYFRELKDPMSGLRTAGGFNKYYSEMCVGAVCSGADIISGDIGITDISNPNNPRYNSQTPANMRINGFNNDNCSIKLDIFLL